MCSFILICHLRIAVLSLTTRLAEAEASLLLAESKATDSLQKIAELEEIDSSRQRKLKMLQVPQYFPYYDQATRSVYVLPCLS